MTNKTIEDRVFESVKQKILSETVYIEEKNNEPEQLEEADVVTYDALDGYTGKIQSGTFVRMGYIDSVEISKSSRYINPENLKKLKDTYKDSDDKPLQRRFMNTVIPDAENFLAGNGKRKTMDFNFGDNLELVNYIVYQMNWMSNEKVADIERRKAEEIQKLRRLYKFGETGAEDTWRAKGKTVKKKDGTSYFRYTYGGPNVMPQTYSQGSTYNKSNDGGEASDERNKWQDPITQKTAFRQSPKAIESRMFLYDTETGEVEEFDKNLYFVLKNEFGRAKVEKAVEELEDEERAYKEALEKIYADKNLQSAHTFKEEKTLWMAYTILMPDKTRQPSKRWINRELKNKYGDIIKKLNIEDKMKVVEDFSDVYGKNLEESTELNETKSFMNRLDNICK